MGVLVLLLFHNFFDVAVLMLVLEWCEALLSLGWLGFAVCLCCEFGGFLLLLGDLLLLDVLGCLLKVSLVLRESVWSGNVPPAMPKQA